jgi:SH3 domain-containing YSC84-like protein 1
MSAQPNNPTGPSGAGTSAAAELHADNSTPAGQTRYRPYRPSGERPAPVSPSPASPSPAAPAAQKQYMPYRPAGSPASVSPATQTPTQNPAPAPAPAQFKAYRPGGDSPSPDQKQYQPYQPPGEYSPQVTPTQERPSHPEGSNVAPAVQTQTPPKPEHPPPVVPPKVEELHPVVPAQEHPKSEHASSPVSSPVVAQDPPKGEQAQDPPKDDHPTSLVYPPEKGGHSSSATPSQEKGEHLIAAALAQGHAESSQAAAMDDNPPAYEEHAFPPPPPGPPPSSSTQKLDRYPPPPPGPPAGSSSQQQNYPPPPPGPPPAQDADYKHPLQSRPVDSPPLGEALPGYTETPGLHFPVDEKPPALPPRPSSNVGASSSFAPPPGSEEAGYSAGSSSAAAAAAAASTSTSGGDAQQASSASDSKKGKKTFGERFYDWSVKTGVPINKITNKLGSEAFWPMSMDKECDKAARILKSFTSKLGHFSAAASSILDGSTNITFLSTEDGFYADSSAVPPSPGHATNPGPNTKSKALVKIPQQALQQAHGLAIFTVFRTGLHISGASGSGLIVSRLPDGTWSPPSGLLVHTLGAGFMVGLDIYDCVCVLRTPEAVRAFAAKPRLSLGGEISVVAGPVGAGKSLEAALGAGKPVWSYMKSRGLYAGVAADGTVIVSRPDANAAFYGEKGVTPERILKGEVRPSAAPAVNAADSKNKEDSAVMWPHGARQLMEVLKSAEGKIADERVMEEVGKGPTPGDLAGTEGVRWDGLKGKEVHEGFRYA